jgi:ligand-binding sensor domain-containing protein
MVGLGLQLSLMIGSGQLGDRGMAQVPATPPVYSPDAPPPRQTPLPNQRQQVEEESIGTDYRISALHPDQRGGLWVGSWQGVAKINPATGQILDRVSVPNQIVGAIAQDKSGRIWVGTYTGLVRLDPQTGTITAQNFALPSNRVLDLLVDQRGYLWVGTDAGLALISPDRGLLMTTLKNLPGVSANALALDALGNLWVGTLDGLVEVDTAKATIKRQVGNLPGVTVQAIASSSWGTLWVGTPTDLIEVDLGLRRVVQTVPVTPAKSRSPKSPIVPKRSASSKTTNRAAATPVQRRVVFLPGPANTFKVRSLTQLRGRNVTTLQFDQINSVWVGTTTGLLRVNPFNGATGGEIINLPSSQIVSLSADPSGKVWVGTREGLAWVNPKTFKAYPHQTFRTLGR